MKLHKILVWLQFICICGLIINHFMRGLNYQPLLFLLIPSTFLIAMKGE